MSTYTRLREVFEAAEEIPFDDSSRIILISDCHRSDNSWADNFANNQNLFFNALEHYYENGFTYIELGDGDELWETRKFSIIRETYSNIFWLLSKYHAENRLYMLWGNHDMVKKYPEYVKENLYGYLARRDNTYKPLFDGLKFHEGLVLKHTNTGEKIFLVHGQQGDLINDGLWPLGRFLCRHIWRNLEIMGVNNPISPAKNNIKRNILENNILQWIQANKQMLIAGHFHRPAFAYPEQPPYFNTGSCVHPRCITGIEIDKGAISLIKWSVKTKSDGTLYIGKDIISGPVRLREYFQKQFSHLNER